MTVLYLTSPEHQSKEYGVDVQRRMLLVRDAYGEAAWTDLRPATDEEIARLTEPTRYTNVSIGYTDENPGCAV